MKVNTMQFCVKIDFHFIKWLCVFFAQMHTPSKSVREFKFRQLFHTARTSAYAHSLMLYNRFSSILFHAKPIFTGNRWTHSISYSGPRALTLALISSRSLTLVIILISLMYRNRRVVICRCCCVLCSVYENFPRCLFIPALLISLFTLSVFLTSHIAFAV